MGRHLTGAAAAGNTSAATFALIALDDYGGAELPESFRFC